VSFDDDTLADLHVDLFETFGVDGTVQRGSADPVGVRIVVDRGDQIMGEYGRTVGRIDSISLLCAQWAPRQGDVLRWTDRLGSHAKAIESEVENDGFVVQVIVHG
jgi:hypothetical protein